nr:immunoglobulin-like domain-containing protein [Pseudomonas monteilii]
MRPFENLQLGGDASVKVTDTVDEVVAKLTASQSVTEGGEITYTITLTNKDGLPINNHAELYFKLTDGTTVIVPANSTPARPLQPRRITSMSALTSRWSMPSTPSAARMRGSSKNLNLDKTPVSTEVTDEPGTPGNEGDIVKVTITADQTSVAENVKPTFHRAHQPAAGSRPGRDPEQRCDCDHQGRRHQRAIRARGTGR